VSCYLLPLFSCNTPPTPGIYTLSLHDALPICDAAGAGPRTFAYVETSDGMSPRIEPGDTVYIDPDQAECKPGREIWLFKVGNGRSEEHTSELQSRENLVCRLLLEKQKANDPHQ